MKINDLLHIYQNELQNIYHRSEIEAVFYKLTEHFWQIKRLDLALDSGLKTPNDKMIQALSELKKNKPWQYITGKTSFCGLDLYVDKNVLIPRPETEELVDWIINDYKNAKKEIRILDIGSGSGAIAIALAKKLPKTKVTALDISEKALKIARKNAEKNQVKINLIQTDILSSPFDLNTYDIIVSNPPYVRNSEKKVIPKNVVDYEPETALFVPDEDPLIFYRKIVNLAVKTNGKKSIFFEFNEFLKTELEQLLLQYPVNDIRFKKDFRDKWRMVKIDL